MMGVEIAALMGLFGLTGAFALVGTVLAGWMAWRIVEKAGLPGWAGLGAILLTLTGIGTIVPLILLWVFAFMRWPRDEPLPARRRTGFAPAASSGGGAVRRRPAALPPPPMALADRRGWQLTGTLGSGGTVALAIDGTSGSLPADRRTGGAPTDLSRARSVGRPAACPAADGRRPARPRGSRHPGRHLHRRRPAAARARAARHQRGALRSASAASSLSRA